MKQFDNINILRNINKYSVLIFIITKVHIYSFDQLKINLCQSDTLVQITRTKTSIRYAKENDKEKRERRKERERKVEGEI